MDAWETNIDVCPQRGTLLTWTSFSFNETRSTICRRAALSGLGFELYAASRIALSLALETSMGSVATPTCRGQAWGRSTWRETRTRSFSSCPWGVSRPDPRATAFRRMVQRTEASRAVRPGCWGAPNQQEGAPGSSKSTRAARRLRAAWLARGGRLKGRGAHYKTGGGRG